jgi:hypothetical protein
MTATIEIPKQAPPQLQSTAIRPAIAVAEVAIDGIDQPPGLLKKLMQNQGPKYLAIF